MLGAAAGAAGPQGPSRGRRPKRWPPLALPGRCRLLTAIHEAHKTAGRAALLARRPARSLRCTWPLRQALSSTHPAERLAQRLAVRRHPAVASLHRRSVQQVGVLLALLKLVGNAACWSCTRQHCDSGRRGAVSFPTPRQHAQRRVTHLATGPQLAASGSCSCPPGCLARLWEVHGSLQSARPPRPASIDSMYAPPATHHGGCRRKRGTAAGACGGCVPCSRGLPSSCDPQ